MRDDAQIMNDCPDFVSVGSMLKAHPQVEGGRRIMYFEASNEGLDQQNDVIMSKALDEAKDFYLRYGNVDIDHFTLIGAKLGIPNYSSYEIGRPLEVAQRGGSTFVKSEIYQGDGPAAEKANMVWAGLTEIKPAQRWYPSVGGQVLAKSIEVGDDGQRRARVSKVRWSNVGLSKTPVNQHVGTCEVVPIGTFAKALTAGYATDSAALSGGSALRIQSLDPVTNYFDQRERLAADVRAGRVSGGSRAKNLVAHASKMFGLSPDAAAETVERFMRDLKSQMEKRA